MVVDFSLLELDLKTDGHVFGALVFHILGMNLIRCATQMLSVDLQTSEVIFCSDYIYTPIIHSVISSNLYIFSFLIRRMKNAHLIALVSPRVGDPK